MSKRQQGLLLVLLASVGYSFMPILAKGIYSLSPELTPTDISLWRFIFAVPVMWLIVLWQRRGWKADGSLPYRQLPILGFLYALSTLTAFAGLERINASLYVVLFFTYPAMVAVLSLFLGQRLSRYGWLALLLTLIGILFTIPDLSQFAGGDLIGVGLALINAFQVAIYFMMNARILRHTSDMRGSIAWVITWTLLIQLLVIPFVGLQFPQGLQTWLTLIGLGLIGTALPIFLIALAIQKIGATQTSIISSIEPAMAMVLALLLLGEVILPGQWFGALLITAGVLLLEMPVRKSKVVSV